MHSTWSRKAFAVLKKQQKAGAQWPRRRASRDELWEAGWRQLTEKFRLREVRILLQPSRKFHEGRHLLYLFSVGTPRPRTLLITQLALGRDPTDLECCPVSKSCLTLCSPTDCRMPGFPVLHYLPEFAQTHVHWIMGIVSLLIVNQNKYMIILMRNGRPGMLLMDWKMGRISDYSRNKKPPDRSRQWSVYM